MPDTLRESHIAFPLSFALPLGTDYVVSIERLEVSGELLRRQSSGIKINEDLDILE